MEVNQSINPLLKTDKLLLNSVQFAHKRSITHDTKSCIHQEE